MEWQTNNTNQCMTGNFNKQICPFFLYIWWWKEWRWCYRNSCTTNMRIDYTPFISAIQLKVARGNIETFWKVTPHLLWRSRAFQSIFSPPPDVFRLRHQHQHLDTSSLLSMSSIRIILIVCRYIYSLKGHHDHQLPCCITASIIPLFYLPKLRTHA